MGAPVLIMAGGTGGHVFPALAVARILRARDREVVWLGTGRGIEARLVPAEGIALDCIRVAGLRGKGIGAWLAAPVRLVIALADAFAVLRRRRPAVVLGMGGFAAGPGGLAAWLLRRPLVIHEQNAVAGLTNRLLAGIAREALEAFPGSFSAGAGARVVGNPVRDEICALPHPAARLADRTGQPRLLVLGGSQGALALNETVPAALARLPDAQRPQVRHQAGAAHDARARAAYAAAGIDADVRPFIDDMAEAYGWADLVVCRSGALTVAELAAAGLGAILVPYPAAVDDHQTGNARFLADAGAAVLLPQAELSPEHLAAALESLLADPAARIEMAVRARGLAYPEAARAVADACLALEAGQ